VALHHLLNVTIIEAAVSDRSGTGKVDPGAALVCGQLSAGGSVEMRLVTLDEEIQQGRIPVPQYLKIDVEGAELRALIGAMKILRTAAPDILSETHSASGGEFRDVHQQCWSLLRDRGYEFTSLTSSPVSGTDQLYVYHPA